MRYAGSTLAAYLDELAAAGPSPAAGTATGFVVASAAALTAMVGRVSDGRDGAGAVVDRAERARGRATVLADADAQAYGEVVVARRAARERRVDVDEDAAVRRAVERATDVPLELAEVAREVVGLAAPLVRDGAASVRADAEAAVHLAAGAVGALHGVVRANATSAELPADRLARAEVLLAEVREAVAALDGSSP